MAEIGDSSSGEKSLPDLERRQTRQADHSAARAETRQRSGEIYLIERQAIELRRLRWSNDPKVARRAKGQPADTRGFDRPQRETAPLPSKPSPRDALVRYARPPADPSRAPADRSFGERIAAWLRQTLLGE